MSDTWKMKKKLTKSDPPPNTHKHSQWAKSWGNVDNEKALTSEILIYGQRAGFQRPIKSNI